MKIVSSNRLAPTAGGDRAPGRRVGGERKPPDAAAPPGLLRHGSPLGSPAPSVGIAHATPKDVPHHVVHRRIGADQRPPPLVCPRLDVSDEYPPFRLKP
jgi:hypothetical protein